MNATMYAELRSKYPIDLRDCDLRYKAAARRLLGIADTMRKLRRGRDTGCLNVQFAGFPSPASGTIPADSQINPIWR
jgi:hypothetical protein